MKRQATVKQRVQDIAQETERDNIICCLRFLSREAADVELKDVANIIKQAVKEVLASEPTTKGKEIHRDFEDLVIAFHLFIKFYLIGDGATREDFLNKLNEMDNDELRTYVY